MAKWGTQNLGGNSDDVSTLLSKDAEFQGTLRIQGSVRVDGVIKGDLVSTQTVTVGQTGAIEGNINAEEIIVAGRVKGTLIARGRVVLESSAQFEGDLTATKLAVVEGALFRGLSNMGTPKATGAVKTEAKATTETKQERIAAA